MSETNDSRKIGDTLSYTYGGETSTIDLLQDEGVHDFIYPLDIAPEKLALHLSGEGPLLTHAGRVFTPEIYFLTAEGPDGTNLFFKLTEGRLTIATAEYEGQFSLNEEYLDRKKPIRLAYEERDGDFLSVHELYAISEEGELTPLSSNLLTNLLQGNNRRPLKFIAGDGTETSADKLKSEGHRFFYAMKDGQRRYLFLTNEDTLREMTVADSMRMFSD